MSWHSYTLGLAAALIIGAVLYAFRLRQRRLKPLAGLLALPLSGMLCAGFAWGFFALMQPYARFSVYRFSFFGGAVGLLLGTALAARLLRQPLRQAMDAYAPAFALQLSMARGAEYFMGDVGLGHYTEVPWLCHPPLAMVNEWNEWYIAVFTIEALAALLIALLALCTEKKTRAPGHSMLRVLYWLCVTQTAWEQLRTMPMTWGFVRAEQLLCAVAGLLLLLLCVLPSRASLAQKWLFPATYFVLCGIVTAMEFALDGKIQMSPAIAWTLIAVSLTAMLALGEAALRRCPPARPAQPANPTDPTKPTDPS